MPKEELHHTLQELRLELDKLHFENDARRFRIASSVDTLEEKLREESFMSGDEYLVHEIQEAIDQFEEDHPQLMDIVGRISDLLGKMGI